jgi:hypothetical protein
MRWIVVLLTVTVISAFGTQTVFAQSKDEKALKWFDDAIEAWYENLDAVGSYIVEYEGKFVDVEDDRHLVTDFSGRTMRLKDKVRTERLVKHNHRDEFPIRAGHLLDGADQYIIEGFHDDSEVRKLSRDKPERIDFRYEVDPFYLIHGGVHNGASPSIFRSRAFHFHSMEPVNVFQVKTGIAAVFKSKTPDYYRVIRFNRELGWMPDLSEAGLYRGKDKDLPPDGDDLQVSFAHRVVWKELRPKVYVPVFYERDSRKYDNTTQVAFDWTNHDRAKEEFFTPAHLQSSHHMQDFAFADRPVLRSAIPGAGLKVDWSPVDK